MIVTDNVHGTAKIPYDIKPGQRVYLAKQITVKRDNSTYLANYI